MKSQYPCVCVCVCVCVESGWAEAGWKACPIMGKNGVHGAMCEGARQLGKLSILELRSLCYFLEDIASVLTFLVNFCVPSPSSSSSPPWSGALPPLPGSFTNQVDNPVVVAESCSLRSDGTIRYLRRLKIQLAEDFEGLADYPFDHHALDIDLESFDYSADQVRLQPWNGTYVSKQTDEIIVHKLPRVPHGTWNVLGFTMSSEIRASANADRDNFIRGHLYISRKCLMPFVEIVLPLLLTFFFTFSAMLFRLHVLDVRTNLSMIGFLTTIMYVAVRRRVAVSSPLPAVLPVSPSISLRLPPSSSSFLPPSPSVSPCLPPSPLPLSGCLLLRRRACLYPALHTHPHIPTYNPAQTRTTSVHLIQIYQGFFTHFSSFRVTFVAWRPHSCLCQLRF